MIKTKTKHLLALVIMLSLIAVTQLAFTQEATAASKKTKYVVTSNIIIYDTHTGDAIKYKYYKNGLVKAIEYPEGRNYRYTYNKHGYVASETYYHGQYPSERMTYKYQYNKKGLAVRKTAYYYGYNSEQKKETLDYVADISNYKSGMMKREKRTYSGGGIVSYTYNTKGDITSLVQIDDSYNEYTYTYQYDKKGNPLKVTKTSSSRSYGESSSDITYTIYKYKYDKHKNISKAHVTEYYMDGEHLPYKEECTIKYKYKKVKVPKKCLKSFQPFNNEYRLISLGQW